MTFLDLIVNVTTLDLIQQRAVSLVQTISKKRIDVKHSLRACGLIKKKLTILGNKPSVPYFICLIRNVPYMTRWTKIAKPLNALLGPRYETNN